MSCSSIDHRVAVLMRSWTPGTMVGARSRARRPDATDAHSGARRPGKDRRGTCGRAGIPPNGGDKGAERMTGAD